MLNIRKLAESDLKTTLEGDFSLPVFLTPPDGNISKYTTSTDGSELSGQVLYDYTRFDPSTGEPTLVKMPVVTLRISNLQRVPLSSERWLVEIPIIPDPDAVKKSFMASPTRSDEGGASIGFIRLYLQEIDQS